MSPRLDIHESAELELNEAADFYDLRSPGLGSAFLDEVERSLGHIAKHPEAAGPTLGVVRKRVLTRFPHVLNRGPAGVRSPVDGLMREDGYADPHKTP